MFLFFLSQAAPCIAAMPGWVSAGRNLFLLDMWFKPQKTWKLLSYRYE